MLQIYDPDRETELADVFRYREYSEDPETIEVSICKEFKFNSIK